MYRWAQQLTLHHQQQVEQEQEEEEAEAEEEGVGRLRQHLAACRLIRGKHLHLTQPWRTSELLWLCLIAATGCQTASAIVAQPARRRSHSSGGAITAASAAKSSAAPAAPRPSTCARMALKELYACVTSARSLRKQSHCGDVRVLARQDLALLEAAGQWRRRQQ